MVCRYSSTPAFSANVVFAWSATSDTMRSRRGRYYTNGRQLIFNTKYKPDHVVWSWYVWVGPYFDIVIFQVIWRYCLRCVDLYKISLMFYQRVELSSKKLAIEANLYIYT